MKKVIILIGNYGSGKTEIALNMAFLAAAEGKRVQVIDLDRINDYFRMSDHVKLLEESNINLVSPTFVGAGITQTNMPAAVGSAFAQDWDLVVFDVGGDPAGALSLARYHMDFAALEPGQLEVYDIINVRRPMSETPEKILKLKGEMEGFARQTVTGFIHNSNLQAWASAADLRDGYPVVKAASEMSGIPVVHTTGRKEFLEEFLQDDGLDPIKDDNEVLFGEKVSRILKETYGIWPNRHARLAYMLMRKATNGDRTALFAIFSMSSYDNLVDRTIASASQLSVLFPDGSWL